MKFEDPSCAAMFQVLLDRFPEIHDHKDRGRFQENFAILWQFAPTLAQTPLVAKGWIVGALDQRGVSPADIRNLVDTETKIRELDDIRARARTRVHAFAAGANWMLRQIDAECKPTPQDITRASADYLKTPGDVVS